MKGMAKSNFLIIALVLAVGAALFMAGCIQQTVSSDCNSYQSGQTYMKALCYEKAAVYASVYGGASARSTAIADCNVILSDPDTNGYAEVYRTCISQAAQNLQDPTVCDQISANSPASFFSSILNIDTTTSMVAACKDAAKSSSVNSPCASVIFILFPLGGVAAVSYYGRKKPATKKR